MKKIVGGVKDVNGIYIKLPSAPSEVEVSPPTSPIVPDSDISLDDIARRIVKALDRATRNLLDAISTGDISRETIGALKDCEAMHRELSKKEKDFLDKASDEELEKLLKK